jgi:hypothetical protein
MTRRQEKPLSCCVSGTALKKRKQSTIPNNHQMPENTVLCRGYIQTQLHRRDFQESLYAPPYSSCYSWFRALTNQGRPHPSYTWAILGPEWLPDLTQQENCIQKIEEHRLEESISCLDRAQQIFTLFSNKEKNTFSFLYFFSFYFRLCFYSSISFSQIFHQ